MLAHFRECAFELVRPPHIELLQLQLERLAACSSSFMSATSSGLSGFVRTATRLIRGNASLSNRVASRDLRTEHAEPVTFPPGRARLVTRPEATGSPLDAMTIGMVVVACLAACVPGVPWVTMTSTFKPHQLGRELVQPLVLSLGPAELDGNVLALHVAEIAQALPQRLDILLELDADGACSNPMRATFAGFAAHVCCPPRTRTSPCREDKFPSL